MKRRDNALRAPGRRNPDLVWGGLKTLVEKGAYSQVIAKGLAGDGERCGDIDKHRGLIVRKGIVTPPGRSKINGTASTNASCARVVVGF